MNPKKVKLSQYYAVFREEAEGGYSVWIPALPGCASQGETFDEALANIKEALDLYLQEEPSQNLGEDESQTRQFLLPITIAHA